MAEEITVKIPQEYFDALEQVNETIQDAFSPESKSFQYDRNILDTEPKITEIAPASFDSSFQRDYEQIGEALFKGGAKSFLDAYTSYKKAEDYREADVEPAKTPINNIVNVDFKQPVAPEDDKSDKDLLSRVLNGLLIGFATLGIVGGTSVLGQLTESAAYLPNYLKNTLLNPAWINSIETKLFNFGSKMIAPFKSLVSVFEKFGKIGSYATKVATIANAGMDNLVTMLSSKAGVILGTIGSKLKFLPFIGTALGFYQTYLRFGRGEYFQGTLEFAGAIAGLFPGIGTGIAIGIGAIQSVLDSDSTSLGGITSAVLRGASKVGASLLPMLSRFATTLIRPLGFVFKKLPFIGSLISFGTAVSDLSNGRYISGILNILSGVATFFPGIGTAVAVGLDVLNYFIGEKASDESAEISSKQSVDGKGWFSNMISWIWDGIKSVAVNVFNSFKMIWWDMPKMLLSGAWNTLSSIGTMIQTAFTTWLSYGSGIIDGITDFFSGGFGGVGESIMSGINSVKNTIINFITSIPDKIGSIASSLLSTLAGGLGGVVASVWAGIDSLTGGIFTETLSDIVNTAKGWFTEIKDKFLSEIGGWFSSITEFSISDTISGWFSGDDKPTTIKSTDFNDKLSSEYSKIKNETDEFKSSVINDLATRPKNTIQSTDFNDRLAAEYANIRNQEEAAQSSIYDKMKNMGSWFNGLFTNTEMVDAPSVPVAPKIDRRLENSETINMVKATNDAFHNAQIVNKSEVIIKANSSNLAPYMRDIIKGLDNIAEVILQKPVATMGNNTIINGVEQRQELPTNSAFDPRVNYAY